MNIKYFLTVAMLLLSAPAFAEWSKPFEVYYIMGDGDNRASARQSAIEQIKLKAAGEAGTYIQSTTTLHENGDLTENIQTIGASMVKISNPEERMSVNSSGQSVLWVRATVSLDDSELVRRVRVLQQDKEKTRQIKQLQSDNEILRQDLGRIRKALASNSDQDMVADLLHRQTATINKIDANGKTISRVFERGTLLQMASRNADSFEEAKRTLEDQFYAPLMRSHVTAEIESVEPVRDGYVAMVRVGWGFDVSHLKEVLSQYVKFDYIDRNQNIRAYDFENHGGRGPSVLSEQVYLYLAGRGVDLQITLAGKEVRMPAFYRDDSFMMPCEAGTDARGGEAKHLCLMSQSSRSADTHGSRSQPSNPIRIHLTKAEATRATSVDASWVLSQ